MKTKMVLLEGIDGTGKSTIFQLYRHATEFKPLILDRFIGSNIAFDKKFKRQDSSIRLFGIENKMMKILDVYLIVLDCGRKEILNRLSKQQGTTKEQVWEDYDLGLEMRGWFRWYYDRTPIKKKFILDTTFIDPIRVTREILKLTNEKERNKTWTRFYRSSRV